MSDPFILSKSLESLAIKEEGILAIWKAKTIAGIRHGHMGRIWGVHRADLGKNLFWFLLS